MADKKKRKKQLEGLVKGLEEAARIEKELDRRDLAEDGAWGDRMAESVEKRPAQPAPAVDHGLLALRARPALIVSAMRRTVLTTDEFATVLDAGPASAAELSPVLDAVVRDCKGLKEPSLAVLVVDAATGEPVTGAAAKRWHADIQKVFRHWTS